MMEVNTELLELINYMEVSDGYNLMTKEQILNADPCMRMILTLHCTPSARHKLEQVHRASINAEELKLYVNLGIKVKEHEEEVII